MGALERVALFLSRLLTVLTVVVARCLFMVWRMPDCSNLIRYQSLSPVYWSILQSTYTDCRQFSCYITE
jgi:hypothetical protein